MKVTVLGTGTSQGVPVIGCECDVCTSIDPKDNRLRCSIVISVDEKNILVDTSPDLRYQMLRSDFSTIDAILYTHEHNDHVVGLDDIRPFNFRQQQDLDAYGLSRVMEDISHRFNYAFRKESYPGAPRVVAHEIDGYNSFSINDIFITPIHVLHGQLPILGYRVDNFAYLTDVSYIPEDEMAKLMNLDVLIISALRKEEHHSHLTLDEALEIIRKVKPKKAFLTHISHKMGKVSDWETDLPENVFSAYDGQEIIL